MTEELVSPLDSESGDTIVVDGSKGTVTILPETDAAEYMGDKGGRQNERHMDHSRHIS